jgi:DNA modification methylase
MAAGGRGGWLAENAIHCGDARTLLPQIRPESIALSFWSPPYFVGKSYERDLTFDDWTALLADVVRLHYSIIAPGGFLAINIADILAFADPSMPRIQANSVTNRRSPVTRDDVLRARAKHPGHSRYQLAELLGCSEQTVDRRLKDNNIRGGKYKPQTRVKLVGGLVEQWGAQAGFYLYDRRIWAKDPCWENSRWHSLSYRSVDEFEYVFVFWKPGITTIDRRRLTPEEWKDWGSRGIWHIPSVRANDAHEAMFPLELARRVVRLLSAPGDLVLDCFVGSGTTAIAALLEGRRYLGLDMVEEYVELARHRLRQVKGREEVRARQLSLVGMSMNGTARHNGATPGGLIGRRRTRWA